MVIKRLMAHDDEEWLFKRIAQLEFENTLLRKQVEVVMTQEEVKEVLCSYFVDVEGMEENAAYLKAAQAASFMFAEGEDKRSGS